MRIYQFDNKDDEINRDIRLMFLVMDDTLSTATSYMLNRKLLIYNWGSSFCTEGLLWMDRDEKIFNTFRYKDTI